MSVAGTGTVATVNVPVVEPAVIVTLAGTVAAALSEPSVNIVPPAGAGLAQGDCSHGTVLPTFDGCSDERPR